MTDTAITPATEAPAFDVEAVEVGDTLRVTKDHITHTVQVFRTEPDEGLGQYILCRDGETVIGFDRTSIAYGIVTVDWA
jgi:hypothetical protein